jgi:enoyl-CoA hydratase/carnithine racemase
VSEEVVREQHGNVLLVRINRPDARNALNDAVCQGVGQAVLDAESDPGIRAMVLTGTGDKSFCAGVDLKEMAAGVQWTPGPPQQALLRLMDGDVAVPVVGASNASALGGGLELLLGCDLIIASSEAQFGLPEVKRGLFPGGSGTAVVQRVPLGVGLEMLLTGEPISASRAYDVHLVNAVVAPDEVVPAALALAERVAANAPLGIAAVRELGRLYATDAAKADERRTHWRGLVFGSEDAKEGATAFAEKRTPVWQGR